MDEKLTQRIIDQFLELWINPELGRRREAGSLDGLGPIYIAQVLFHDDKPSPEVLFNDETRVARVQADAIAIDPAATQKHPADAVVLPVRLTDADPNAGHVTMVHTAHGWICSFDFTRNVGRSREIYFAAREFYSTAYAALESDHFRSVVENLFHAVELAARGLLMLHNSQLVAASTHKAVKSAFNNWGRFGNVEKRYTQLLNILDSHRGACTYLKATPTVTRDLLESLVEQTRDLLDLLDERLEASRRIPQKTD
jgi:uncharacterized protein (UPF0332 family)